MENQYSFVACVDSGCFVINAVVLIKLSLELSHFGSYTLTQTLTHAVVSSSVLEHSRHGADVDLMI